MYMVSCFPSLGSLQSGVRVRIRNPILSMMLQGNIIHTRQHNTRHHHPHSLKFAVTWICQDFKISRCQDFKISRLRTSISLRSINWPTPRSSANCILRVRVRVRVRVRGILKRKKRGMNNAKNSKVKARTAPSVEEKERETEFSQEYTLT